MGFIINPYRFSSALIAVEVKGAFQDATFASTYNFTSCDYGTADVDRYIVVVIARGGSGANTVDSVTMNGVSATVSITLGANLSSTGIAIAKVPTGTTGLTTTVVLSGNGTGLGIQIYRLFSGGTIAVDATATKGTAGALNINENVSNGGAGFLVKGCRTGGASSGVVGLITPIDEDNTTITGSGNYFAAHYVNEGSGDEPSHNFQFDSAGDRENVAVVTYQPA